MPSTIPENYPENGGYFAPPGVAVSNNMAIAAQYAATHSAIESYVWFYNQVRNGGPWDYKQKGSYEGFGNFNYGATGRAMGIPEYVLQNLAGVAQIIAGTSSKDWGAVLWSPPYRDDPLDQRAIMDGINWANARSHSSSEIYPESHFVDFSLEKLMGMFSSSANAQDIREFAYALAWLSHENGSAFYENYKFSDLNDPDADAWQMYARLKQYAKKLGISVAYDEVEQKVLLGIASPIVLDLDGDGIRTTAYAEHSVFFDIDGDTVLDRTAWIVKGDAFLVLDANKNGIVDGVSEMFGGLDRGEGYAKLAQLDSNADGLVTGDDDAYEVLQVWQDFNMNGLTDLRELKSLDEVDVKSISINYTSQEVYQNSNLIGEVSSGVLGDQKMDVADVYFRYKSGAMSASNGSPDEGSLQRAIDDLIQTMALSGGVRRRGRVFLLIDPMFQRNILHRFAACDSRGFIEY